MKYKVAVVDDHNLIRAGLAAMINQMDEFTVSHQAANGKEFLELLEEGDPPLITVLDLNMPVMDGFETLTILKQRFPEIYVIVLTLDDSEESLVKSIRFGARGFVKKNAQPGTLERALKSIELTGYYHTEETHQTLIKNPQLQTRDERIRAEVLLELTPRESEFLSWVCHQDELTYSQIADKMGISARTVDHFRKEIFEKFHIKSKAGLVLFAVKWNLVKF